MDLFKKTMGYLRRFTHDYLGWHDGKGSLKGFDGCSMMSRCSQCGKRVLQDSQGGWFLSSLQDKND